MTVNCSSFLVSILCISIITLAPEIIIPPSSETVYSDNTKEFTCHTRNADYVQWKLNGTIAGANTSPVRSNDVSVSSDGAIASGSITTLTIKARLEYHGLVIECVAVMVDVDIVMRMSKNATLMVQGTVELRLVGHVANMYTDLIHPLPVQVCWIHHVM